MIRITYFVHGTTTDNENNISTGWNQGELSELGVEQSKELREQAGDRQFDVVFSSDLKRAVDSAELAFGSKYEIIQDKRLREVNYGDLNGHPDAEVKSDVLRYVAHPFPNGESYRDVERRMADFLDYLKEKYRGKHIAIMSHHAPQMALDVRLQGKTWEQAFAEDWRKTKSPPARGARAGWQPGWEYELD